MTATQDVPEVTVVTGTRDMPEADPGEPAWEWRNEYLHEMKD